MNKVGLKLNKNKIFFLSLAIFFLTLAYNTPLTGDDWTWGTEAGLDRLKNWFKDYNGRYLGNLVELAITRNEVVRIILMGLGSALLVYLTAKIIEVQKWGIYLLAFILVMSVPVNVFAQTFAWAAGFANYITSLCFLIFYLLIVRNIYNDEVPKYRKSLYFIVIPLGIITQLFVEHITVFVIYTSIFVIFYTYIKHKKFFGIHIAFMISNIIGFIIMFSNGAYWNIINGSDSYRSIKTEEAAIETGILEKIYTEYSGYMHKFLFLNNFVLNLFICILVILLVTTFKENGKLITPLKYTISLFMAGYMLYGIIIKPMVGPDFLGHLTVHFETILTLLFFVALVFAVLFFVTNNPLKVRLLYYLSGVILLTAPFIFITPFGPRCVLASYIFMVIISLELFVYVLKENNWSEKVFTPILLYVAIVFTFVYFFVFSMNGQVNRERLVHIEKELEKQVEVIEVRERPYRQFHWMSSPLPHLYQGTTFKKYYNIPNDVEVKIIPYRKWRDKE